MKYFVTDILIDHKECRIQILAHICESLYFLSFQYRDSRNIKIYYIGYRCHFNKLRKPLKGVKTYKLGGGAYLIMVDRCNEYEALTKLDIVIVDGYIRDWKPVICVLVRGTSQLKSLLKYLYSNDLRPFVIGMRSINNLKNKVKMSKRQEQILALAYSRGFFNKPRGVSLINLSKELNITASTLNEIIRAGVRKLVEQYLIDNGLITKIK